MTAGATSAASSPGRRPRRRRRARETDGAGGSPFYVRLWRLPIRDSCPWGGRRFTLRGREGAQQARDLGERARNLLALLPIHEIAHRLTDGFAFAQHEVCLLGDG